MYAYEGQDAEIACDVEGESSATWSRIDGELPTNCNVTQGKLIITDVQFADAGTRRVISLNRSFALLIL